MPNFYYWHIFICNFDFKCTLFSKSVPNFWPSKPKRTKSLEFFYTHQVGVEAKLNSAKPSLIWGHVSPASSEVTLMAWCTSHFFRQIELLSTYYQGLNLSYLMHHVVVLVFSYMANSLPSFSPKPNKPTRSSMCDYHVHIMCCTLGPIFSYSTLLDAS